MVDTGDKVHGGLPRGQVRILIVEDDPLMASIYSHALSNAGFEWEVVADGSDAFHRLHQKTYDLVILDLMLPTMDGLAILRRIRAQKKFLTLPILVITAMNIATVQAQLQAAGASMMIAKTDVAPKKLIEAVNSLIAAVPFQPLDLLPTPKIEEPLIEEIRQRPDFRVQSAPEDAALPAAKIRMASHPDTPAAPAKPASTADPAGVRITEDTEDTKEPKEKSGFFKRVFGKKK